MSVYLPGLEKTMMRVPMIDRKSASLQELDVIGSSLSNYLFLVFDVGIKAPAEKKGYELVMADKGFDPDKALGVFGRDGFGDYVRRMMEGTDVNVRFGLSKRDGIGYIGGELYMTPGGRLPLDFCFYAMYKPGDNPSKPAQIFYTDVRDLPKKAGDAPGDLAKEFFSSSEEMWDIGTDGMKDIESSLSRVIDEYERHVLPEFVRRNPDKVPWV